MFLDTFFLVPFQCVEIKYLDITRNIHFLKWILLFMIFAKLVLNVIVILSTIFNADFENCDHFSKNI